MSDQKEMINSWLEQTLKYVHGIPVILRQDSVIGCGLKVDTAMNMGTSNGSATE